MALAVLIIEDEVTLARNMRTLRVREGIET
jgi:hypothetical protein